MFNIIEASNNIKNDFNNFLVSNFYIKDDLYRESFKQELSKEGNISKGPFVQINSPFKKGKSLKDLMDEGLICSEFSKLEKGEDSNKQLPLNRPLYNHQENAIRIINGKNHNAVITTGTGSGKTESFLIPILNELLKEKENGTLDNPGIRVLLIYPMKALASDQVKRLRSILKKYPEITFGVFDGNTKNKESDARLDYISIFKNNEDVDLREPIDNEYLSKERIRNSPPHILFTNYSMLEHMLLKPNNMNIFQGETLKFIVLDESHIYQGATGMESALLFRRLKARVLSDSSNLKFILTSATLGNKGENDENILKFAYNLTGNNFEKEDIIFGDRIPIDTSKATKDISIHHFKELVNLIESLEKEKEKDIYTFDKETLLDIEKNTKALIENIFKKNDISFNNSKDLHYNIFNFCEQSILYKNLVDYGNLFNIDNFCNDFCLDKYDFSYFLMLLDYCFKDNLSLIDIKYHLFIRGLDGLYTSLVDDNKVYITKKEVNDKGFNLFERVVCSNCGDLGIYGRVENNHLVTTSKFFEKNKKGDLKYFTIKKSFEIDNDFEEDFILNDFTEEEEIEKQTNKTIRKINEIKICPKCGLLVNIDEKLYCDCEEKSPLILIENESSCRCNKCRNGNLLRFYVDRDKSTGDIAVSLFDNLKEKDVEIKDDDEIHHFSGGKQFLCFSDNRNDAAFFAPYLSKYQNNVLRKRALLKIINKLDEPTSFEDVTDEIFKLFRNEKSFIDDLCNYSDNKTINRDNAITALLKELIDSKKRNSLISLGFFDYYVEGIDKIAILLADKFEIDKNLCKKLVNYLVCFFIWNGCVKDDELVDNDYIFNNFLYYHNTNNSMKMENKGENKKDSKSSIYYFSARNKPGKIDEFYNNLRLYTVQRVLNCNLVTANEFLKKLFELLVSKNIILKNSSNSDYCLKTNKIMIKPKSMSLFYQCSECGKITTHNLNGYCNEYNCSGKLSNISPDYSLDGFYLSNLKGCIIKEHTAQLSKDKGKEYQEKFGTNRIHALSCSTTFEMGVDVGKLETVFLRNVPPLASNYIQRAGRAGRGKDSSSLCICFCKLSAHDYYYFNNAEKMISGKILPPIFKLDNEKIVYRHINSILLSYYFEKNPKIFEKSNPLAIDFIDNDYESFKELLEDLPKELIDLLEKSIPNFSKFKNFKEKLIGDKGFLSNAIIEFNETMKILEKELKDSRKKSTTNEISYIQRLNNSFKSIPLIDFFVKNNILPQYGFPIDSVELKILDSESNLALNLTRDLKVAISEYSPGSEIVADDKIFKSRYINKMIVIKDTSFSLGFNIKKIGYCKNCDSYNYFNTNECFCKFCNKEIKSKLDAIIPSKGFTSDRKNYPIKMKPPKKSSTNSYYYIKDISNTDIISENLNGHIIELSKTDSDKVLTLSNSSFLYCPKCGYSELNKDIFSKSKEVNHKNTFGKDCDCKKLNPIRLIDVCNTDIVVIDFKDTKFIDINNKPNECAQANSVLYAILDSISLNLLIERKDINGLLFKEIDSETGKYKTKLMLYDTVSGGAGNVKRLFDKEISLESIFKTCLETLSKCSCDKSCYNCLRNYGNQEVHDILDRKLAIQFFEQFFK